MKLLLDTHIFLWFVTADTRLTSKHRDAVRDPANDVWLSAASVWEAVIKHAIGKRPTPVAPAVFFPQQRIAHGISSLAVSESALTHLATLPLLHRDPFDRMLIAQAIDHGLTMVTSDPAILRYAVSVLPER